MGSKAGDRDDIKRRIRKLKQAEIRIRFGPAGQSRHAGIPLVWETFFDLGGKPDTAVPSGSEPGGRARLSLEQLAGMSRSEYAEMVGEFFWHVYYRLYRETGRIGANLFDPDSLARLGLPPEADRTTVRKRFRELAKKLHPDTGGDAARFIELMEHYRELVGP
ncbi:MAG: J domain-containing protein [Clostridia bacterium]|nr:J domain-containing protein [Clostridia bacterium]